MLELSSDGHCSDCTVRWTFLREPPGYLNVDDLNWTSHESEDVIISDAPC